MREDDPIYNGAQDNASGTAGLLAIAEKFAQQPAPERSIVFAAVGAEENGLLGSAWYADHPLFPLASGQWHQYGCYERLWSYERPRGHWVRELRNG